MKKALLLESIHPVAEEMLRRAGYQIVAQSGSMSASALIRAVKDVRFLGVRSKTLVTKEVIAAAKELQVVGAYCIGTDRIDLTACSERGIAVFNDPHSNSRSVAEMVVGNIIALARRIFPASVDLHQGVWNKSAAGCHEVRGRTLGIVGYGRIGSQLSQLAEAMGMKVIFFDSARVLPRGNAAFVSRETLFEMADVVSVHVDGRPENKNSFGEREFRMMKKGVIFINASRGSVVDCEALARNISVGQIAGAAIDVFPSEPDGGGTFSNPLQGLPNVLLTPHIGGSTEEAQASIGKTVSERFLEYRKRGSTMESVNMPQCDLPYHSGSYRIAHLHENVKGVVAGVSSVIAHHGINIEKMEHDTNGNLGYVLFRTDKECSAELLQALRRIPHTIRCRALAG